MADESDAVSEETVPPDWAFSPDQNLKCPECDEPVAGLNWKLNTVDLVDAMDLVPCGHSLDTAVWELKFSGRDRKFGTVIRTPKFVQKG